jgi:hypothetical protein
LLLGEKLVIGRESEGGRARDFAEMSIDGFFFRVVLAVFSDIVSSMPLGPLFGLIFFGF